MHREGGPLGRSEMCVQCVGVPLSAVSHPSFEVLEPGAETGEQGMAGPGPLTPAPQPGKPSIINIRSACHRWLPQGGQRQGAGTCAVMMCTWLLPAPEPGAFGPDLASLSQVAPCSQHTHTHPMKGGHKSAGTGQGCSGFPRVRSKPRTLTLGLSTY